MKAFEGLKVWWGNPFRIGPRLSSGASFVTRLAPDNTLSLANEWYYIMGSLMNANLRWWLGLRPVVSFGSPPAMTVSVLIPAYNEAASIADTIRSIQAQDIKIDKIIVVDDCSTDNTGDIARSMGVTVIRTPKNTGTKARAQNYGIELVETDLVVSVDADTTFDPEAIRLTLPYFNDPKTCAVCGFVVPAKRRTMWERGRHIDYLWGLSLMKSAQNHIGAVLVASGCFTTFRTDLIRKVGGFNLRTKGEDMDLTWDLTSRGYRVYYESKAVCYVIDPPDKRRFIGQVDRWHCSYMENIKVRKFRLGKLRQLGYAVYIYMGWSVFGILVPPSLVAIRWGFHPEIIPVGYFGALLLQAFIIAPFVLYKAWWLGERRLGKHPMWETSKCFPAYYVVLWVSQYLFLRAIWRVLIRGKFTEGWIKGH